MSQLTRVDQLLWCAALALVVIDLAGGPLELGRLGLVVGGLSLANSTSRGLRELRRAFENGIGRAYYLGRRAERRETEADEIAPVRVLRRR